LLLSGGPAAAGAGGARAAGDGVADAIGFEAKGSELETTMTMFKLEGCSGEAQRQCISARCWNRQRAGRLRRLYSRVPFGDAFEKGIGFKAEKIIAKRFYCVRETQKFTWSLMKSR
jgi:hypothetical protein